MKVNSNNLTLKIREGSLKAAVEQGFKCQYISFLQLKRLATRNGIIHDYVAAMNDNYSKRGRSRVYGLVNDLEKVGLILERFTHKKTGQKCLRIASIHQLYIFLGFDDVDLNYNRKRTRHVPFFRIQGDDIESEIHATEVSRNLKRQRKSFDKKDVERDLAKRIGAKKTDQISDAAKRRHRKKFLQSERSRRSYSDYQKHFNPSLSPPSRGYDMNFDFTVGCRKMASIIGRRSSRSGAKALKKLESAGYVTIERRPSIRVGKITSEAFKEIRDQPGFFCHKGSLYKRLPNMVTVNEKRTARG